MRQILVEPPHKIPKKKSTSNQIEIIPSLRNPPRRRRVDPETQHIEFLEFTGAGKWELVNRTSAGDGLALAYHTTDELELLAEADDFALPILGLTREKEIECERRGC